MVMTRGGTHPAQDRTRWGAPRSRKDRFVSPEVAPPPSLVSVQVGTPRDYLWLGRPLRSSIVKDPVSGPVAVGTTHLEGDVQADPSQHGGPDKAAYAYAVEDLDWWATNLGRAMPPGMCGENLTTRGLDLREATIGERWRIGTAVLQVTEPRTPCWKLGMRMGDKHFPRAFTQARRTGVLLRVLQTGHVQKGDAIEVDGVPEHGVRAADVTSMYLGDDVDVPRVLAASELAAHWHKWAAHRTIWHLDEERKRGET